MNNIKIKEIRIDSTDGRKYNYTEYENGSKEIVYLITEQEQEQQIVNEEIQELNAWLDLRRNIEHPDKASKQARLLELLG